MRAFNSVCALILLALSLNCGTTVVVASEYDELCSLFKDGMKIQMPASCTDYIYCDNHTANLFTCLEPATFDRTAQSCVQKTPEMKSNEPDNCRNRCEGLDNKFIADPASCNGYYYCQKGNGIHTECPNGLHFNENAQMCIYPSSACVGVSSLCELVPEGTQFRDETNCNKYFKCVKGKLTSANCKITKNEPMEYYNDDKGKCVDKKLIDCTAHPIPTDICIKDKKPYHGMTADRATCHGYFYCKNLGVVEDIQPLWYKCPEGLFFHEKQQKCTDPLEVSCAYNRCYGRGNKMVQSNDCYCHTYIKCKDNFEVGTYECSNDLFFNELTQSCAKSSPDFECCDKACTK